MERETLRLMHCFNKVNEVNIDSSMATWAATCKQI